MERRKLRETFLNGCAAVPLAHHCHRTVCGVYERRCGIVIELRIRTGPQGRKRLVARQGQEPRGRPRLSFETTGLAPHIDENIADDIFSQWSVWVSRRTKRSTRTWRRACSTCIARWSPLAMAPSKASSGVPRCTADREPYFPCALQRRAARQSFCWQFVKCY